MSFENRRRRRWLLALYCAGVLIATWQRGLSPTSRDHSTFTIFRQSFVHLAAHQNLYASYPEEQGAASVHKFKYSPSAAVLFAPLSAVPYPVALLFWNALNAGLLLYALAKLLPAGRANLAMLILAPEVFVAIQASSSNALVTALIILAAMAYQEERVARAAMTVATGVAIKIFPLAAFSLAVLQRRWKEAALAAACAGIVLFALPLLVASPAELLQQYRWWWALERSDAQDVMFGLSLMRQFRGWWGVEWPNWMIQLIGTLGFLLPLALRRGRWSDGSFQRTFLCSLLVYVTIFNHQAERQSFVIAAAGCTIWYVMGRKSVERSVLLFLAIIGVPTVPYLIMWLAMQAELLRGIPSASSAAVDRVPDIGSSSAPLQRAS